jgi:DNA-binding GntR family transcriptional regulator
MKVQTPRKPRLTRVEMAYAELKSRIMDNLYPPNRRYLESELAVELGMSRTPIREALIRLEKDGLIELTPRHGMRVVPLSADDMREINEALACLETAAAEMFARQRPSAEDLAPLEQAVQDMETALEHLDLEAWANADERFHRTLLEKCGNRRISDMAFGVWDIVHRARMLAVRLLPAPVKSTKEHRELLEALRKCDPEAARTVHKRQRARATRELVRVLGRSYLQGI